MTLLRGGVDHNALHLLFYFKVSKTLNAKRVSLVKVVRDSEGERACHCLSFLRCEFSSSGNLGEKFFAVHDVMTNSNFEVRCAEN